MPGEAETEQPKVDRIAAAEVEPLRVISFDIDGTLEIGEPPGRIPLDVVRRAIDLGFVVGSCSDRPIAFQQALWTRHEVDVDFTVLKQNLSFVRAEFPAEAYLHIGDSLIDRMMAEQSGFDFVHSVEDDLTPFLAALSIAPSA